MCSYSFVSIFAFILTFCVSTGNAIKCYECLYIPYGGPGERDPNCQTVNARTRTATFSKSFFSSGWEGCLFTMEPHPNGGLKVERKGYSITTPALCEYLVRKGPRSRCHFCFKDLCNDENSLPVSQPTCPPPPKCPPQSTCPPPTTCPTCPTPNMS